MLGVGRLRLDRPVVGEAVDVVVYLWVARAVAHVMNLDKVHIVSMHRREDHVPPCTAVRAQQDASSAEPPSHLKPRVVDHVRAEQKQLEARQQLRLQYAEQLGLIVYVPPHVALAEEVCGRRDGIQARRDPSSAPITDNVSQGAVGASSNLKAHSQTTWALGVASGMRKARPACALRRMPRPKIASFGLVPGGTRRIEAEEAVM